MGSIPGAPRPSTAIPAPARVHPPRRGRCLSLRGWGNFSFPSATFSSKGNRGAGLAGTCRGWWQGGTKPALCALTALRGDLIVFPSSEQQFAGSQASVII